jgi:hypothetical protein
MEYLREIKEFITNHADSSKNEIGAATKLISRLEKLCVEFSKTDRNRLLQELKELTREHEIEELEGNTLEMACEITGELSSIEGIERQIKADTLSLIALNYLIKDVSRDQILNELKEDDWFFKHEVLTRWSWSSAQKKALQKGASFNSIYLCKVDPDQKRRNLDREFFTYLKFMHHYYVRYQQDYLIYKYNGVETNISPDFILIDDNGNQLGIEVTEARDSDDDFEKEQEDVLMSKNGYRNDEMEYRTIKAVHLRIEKKTSGQKPTITPSLLVIYDNVQLLGTDYKKLIEITKNEFGAAPQTYFREIWLIDDKQGIQLFKTTDSV